MLRTFGGDFQVGTSVKAAIGTNTQAYNILFPLAFLRPDPPIVVANVVNATNQWTTDIGIVSNTFFSMWANLIGGGAATENLSIKWVAWYP